MATTDKIKSKLIDKIQTIENRDFLLALDKLISSSNQSEPVSLTSEQIEMHKMSEEDIAEGRITPNGEVDQNDLRWLSTQ